MPDPIVDNPRLAEIYDALDPDRSDLDVYAAMVDEFGARSVLDIGCGTGTFACMLAQRGFDVTGVDPAAASLDVARTKSGAERVRWIRGDATTLPRLHVDLAVMTANVAQVFLTDEAWMATLQGILEALRPAGRLIFEARDPARRAWEDWTRAKSFVRVDIPGIGVVESWDQVTAVDGPLVTFGGETTFESDGAVVTSRSTLRFRDREEITGSLQASEFRVVEVRDAPDRPGREFVVVAATIAGRAD
ncbi:class I SAM-dependent methyltransferase [Rathayibacter soli]|uniref:class I SAM-dependent methyltransferase n=1 Tax=Rathayibacter soli TaxID=3144168 RepID=UPI0027E3B7E8|nr:class I SAM-dependent methyltransferase [Glaciibacter superstes]